MNDRDFIAALKRRKRGTELVLLPDQTYLPLEKDEFRRLTRIAHLRTRKITDLLTRHT